VRAKGFAAVAAATAIVALVFGGPAGAAGKPANRHPKPKTESTKAATIEGFALRGTNGYAVGVTLRDRHELVIAVLPPGAYLAATDYKLEAQQVPGSDTIKARFGKLGKIDMRFVRGATKEEANAPGCTGAKTKVEKGHWVGLIVFRGERGYTEARASHRTGAVVTEPAQTCRATPVPTGKQRLAREIEEVTKRTGGKTGESKEGEREPEAHVLELKAKSDVHGRQVIFSASRASIRERKGKGFAFTNFVVQAQGHLGKIEETGAAFGILEPGSDFRVPDITHLTREVVIGPATPFSGTGTYRQPNHSATWTGDLAVNLPGFGRVPLAGRRTTATLCADDGCQN
jgi:hypothetical protein